MRKTQLKLIRMRKYKMLVNRTTESSDKAVQLLYKLEGTTGYQAIATLEEKLDIMRGTLSNERSQRWRVW
eukprot:7399727-Heterocapsa_arctica.AAC.1